MIVLLIAGDQMIDVRTRPTYISADYFNCLQVIDLATKSNIFFEYIRILQGFS